MRAPVRLCGRLSRVLRSKRPKNQEDRMTAQPAASPSQQPAQETLQTRIGALTFKSGYPTQATVDKLYNEMDFQRACQAYV